jgi:hypothetical protein
MFSNLDYKKNKNLDIPFRHLHKLCGNLLFGLHGILLSIQPADFSQLLQLMLSKKWLTSYFIAI